LIANCMRLMVNMMTGKKKRNIQNSRGLHLYDCAMWWWWWIAGRIAWHISYECTAILVPPAFFPPTGTAVTILLVSVVVVLLQRSSRLWRRQSTLRGHVWVEIHVIGVVVLGLFLRGLQRVVHALVGHWVTGRGDRSPLVTHRRVVRVGRGGC
jgi:hypothetical protein